MARARTPATKPYHHGDLRRALLDAALALAAERGAAGVTLREAARIAGVSQTAPYRHFADKQAMLAAVAEEGFHLFDEEIRHALATAAPDPTTQLVCLGVAYVRFALDHAAHFRLMFGHGSPPKSASPGLQAAARRAFQLFFGTVERCAARRPHEVVVKEISFRLWALAHGIATLALEKQILFDVDAETLARTTRNAMTDLLAISAAPRSRRTRA
jgi:AcrR family transcriptional regulator